MLTSWWRRWQKRRQGRRRFPEDFDCTGCGSLLVPQSSLEGLYLAVEIGGPLRLVCRRCGMSVVLIS